MFSMQGKNILYLIGAVFVLIVLFTVLIFSKDSKLHSTLPRLVEKCGVQECHGLDLTCGDQVVDMCTEMYTMGDGCRSFFKCGLINGECQQVPDQRFEYCKSCVTKCIADHSDDPEKSFLCDSQCLENVKTEKL